jgi:plastocyanin
VSWAVLLAVVALGAGSVAADGERYRIVTVTYYGQHHHKTKRACQRHGDRHCRKHPQWRMGATHAPQPVVRPTPAPTATPPPSPTPLPSRTSVDLTDNDDIGWQVAPAYHELRAGPVEFNATNLGMDDHDFSIRATGPALATIPLLPGESGTLQITLTPGVYTLYCSVATHESRGMRADITIRESG